MISIPLFAVALLPAIIVESLVLARMLAVGWGRGLWLATVANILSAVLGSILAFVGEMLLVGGTAEGEPGREAAFAMLVPMFLVTWWIEHATIRRIDATAPSPRVRQATFVANALTYAIMAIAVAFLVPPASALVSRWKVTEALMRLGVQRTAVAEQFQRDGRFPAPAKLDPMSPYVRSLAHEGNGRIVAELSFPGSADADGKRIVYEPRVAGGQIIEWVCYSPDLHFKYLPATCRKKSAPGKAP